jgi:hypothetical protein
MHCRDGEKTKVGSAQAPAPSRPVQEGEADLPVYYDSEPSSQPPQYETAANRASVKSQTAPHAHQTGSGAPASTVAALLADPEPECKEYRSVRERWKDWKARNFHRDDHFDSRWDVRGSSTQWNVLGSSVKGLDNEKSRRLR